MQDRASLVPSSVRRSSSEVPVRYEHLAIVNKREHGSRSGSRQRTSAESHRSRDLVRRSNNPGDEQTARWERLTASEREDCPAPRLDSHGGFSELS